MRPLHFLGALALGALDGAARVAIPGFYGATGDDRAELQARADKADADRAAVAKRAASMITEAQKRTADANARAQKAERSLHGMRELYSALCKEA